MAYDGRELIGCLVRMVRVGIGNHVGCTRHVIPTLRPSRRQVVQQRLNTPHRLLTATTSLHHLRGRVVPSGRGRGRGRGRGGAR